MDLLAQDDAEADDVSDLPGEWGVAFFMTF